MSPVYLLNKKKSFFTDNDEWGSKKLWKMISTDVKANKNNKK